MAEESDTASSTVEVVYALPDAQHIVCVAARTGMTAAEAVARSGLADRFAEIAAAPLVLGLFGRRIDADHRVEPGDRIEICRPLQADPREMRKFLTATGRVIGQREGTRDND